MNIWKRSSSDIFVLCDLYSFIVLRSITSVAFSRGSMHKLLCNRACLFLHQIWDEFFFIFSKVQCLDARRVERVSTKTETARGGNVVHSDTHTHLFPPQLHSSSCKLSLFKMLFSAVRQLPGNLQWVHLEFKWKGGEAPLALESKIYSEPRRKQVYWKRHWWDEKDKWKRESS